MIKLFVYAMFGVLSCNAGAREDIRELEPYQILPLVPDILEQAENGDANAQFDLSILYGRGIGVEQSPNKVRYWRGRAAENGQPEAQYWTGYTYLYGQGEEKDFEKAYDWYKKSAEGGYVNAMSILGALYTEYVKDLERAKYWYSKAAKKGHAYANFKMGCYAYFGIQQDVDRKEAHASFTRSAKAGDGRAKAFLEENNIKALRSRCL